MRVVNGTNAAIDYKIPNDAELYGLKIRHLLTPSPEHPIPFVREAAEKMSTSFSSDNHENATSRLGFIASAGLIASIMVAFIALAGRRLWNPADLVASASALSLSSLLLATVGGFGALIALIAPHIRAYNRIVVFIAFFSLFIVGSLIAKFRNGRKAALIAVLMGVLGISDELWAKAFLNNQAARSVVADERVLVTELEANLPKGSAIFQLPYTTFPIENNQGKMGPYDHARPYILSNHLRWSWGNILGRDPDSWAATVSQMLPEDMLARLVKAGFVGLWIDKSGYSDPDLAIEVTRLVQLPPRLSPSGRYAFFDIRSYRGSSGLIGDDTSKQITRPSRPMPCHVDVIRIVETGVVRSRVLEVLGWAADSSLNVGASPLTIRLRSASNTLYGRAPRVSRPDVASAMNSASMNRSGFQFNKSLDAVPSGVYEIDILLRETNGPIEECRTIRSVEIR
jgi:phosphoglycerol transferase